MAPKYIANLRRKIAHETGLKAKGTFAMCAHCMAGDKGQWDRGTHTHTHSIHTLYLSQRHHVYRGRALARVLGQTQFHKFLCFLSFILHMLPSQMTQRLTVPVLFFMLPSQAIQLCYRHRRFSASKSSAARTPGEMSWLNPNPKP